MHVWQCASIQRVAGVSRAAGDATDRTAAEWREAARTSNAGTSACVSIRACVLSRTVRGATNVAGLAGRSSRRSALVAVLSTHEPLVQRLPRQAEQPGGDALIALGARKGLVDERLLGFVERGKTIAQELHRPW